MKIEKTAEGIKVTDISGLSLPDTLDCGQCFRWKPDENGVWKGVVRGVLGKIRAEEDGIIFIGASEEEFKNIWFDYFDFDRDYDALKADFSANEMINAACEFAPGIRVLRQEPWEAFITFIISQNNNIARIKGIVERLCTAFGEEIEERVDEGDSAAVGAVRGRGDPGVRGAHHHGGARGGVAGGRFPCVLLFGGLSAAEGGGVRAAAQPGVHQRRPLADEALGSPHGVPHSRGKRHPGPPVQSVLPAGH